MYYGIKEVSVVLPQTHYGMNIRMKSGLSSICFVSSTSYAKHCCELHVESGAWSPFAKDFSFHQ